jgi:hypothetical protein
MILLWGEVIIMDFKYEYGTLKRFNGSSTTYCDWEFSDRNNTRKTFGYYYDLIDCLNELGEDGWKLVVKDGENEYLMVRKVLIKN